MKKYKVTSIPLPKAKDGVPGPTIFPERPLNANEAYTPEYFNSLYNTSYTSDAFDDPKDFMNAMRNPQTGEFVTNCPEGYEYYKGECIPRENAQELMDEHLLEWKEDDYQQRSLDAMQFNNKMSDLSDKSQQQKIDVWLNIFKRSSKSQRIHPLDTYSKETMNRLVPAVDKDGNIITDENGNQLTETILDQVKKTHYVEKVHNKYNVYPLEAMQSKIWHNGFNENQFKNYWGLDPKQVKEQLGTLIDKSANTYSATMRSKIYTRALEQGESIEDVIKDLRPGLGVQENMQTKFEPDLSRVVQEGYDDLVGSVLKGYDEEQAKKIKYDLEKQFDFSNVSGWSKVKDQDLSVWKIANDVDKKYSNWWIGQGKDQEEKNLRANIVKKAQSTIATPPDSGIFSLQDGESSLPDISDEKYNQHQGYDAFSGMDEYIKTTQQNLYAKQSSDARKLSNQAAAMSALNEATGMGEALQAYMTDHAGGAKNIREIIEKAYNNKNITEGDKAYMLGQLVKDVENIEKGEDPKFEFKLKDGTHLFDLGRENATTNDMFDGDYSYNDEMEALYTPGAYQDHLWDLQDPSKTLRSSNHAFQEASLGSKIWDVMSNPADALMYALDDRKEMWGTDGMSYNEKKEFERTHAYERQDGTFKFADMNTAKWTDHLNPITLAPFLLSGINPFHIADELSRTPTLDRGIDLGYDFAMDMATLVSGGGSKVLQGANTLNKINKIKKTLSLAKGPGGLNKLLGKTAPIINTPKTSGISQAWNKYQNFWQGLGDFGTYAMSGTAPTRYAANWIGNSMKYGMVPYVAESLKPDGYIHQGLKDISNYDFGSAANNLFAGHFALPLAGGQALRGIRGLKNFNFNNMLPGRFTTNTGKKFGSEPLLKKGMFNNELDPNIFHENIAPYYTKKDYKNLVKELHPDVIKFRDPSLKDWQAKEKWDLMSFMNQTGAGSKNTSNSILFNEAGTPGLVEYPYGINTKFGKFEFGKPQFQTKKNLWELTNTKKEKYKKGGKVLPKARIGLGGTGVRTSSGWPSLNQKTPSWIKPTSPLDINNVAGLTNSIRKVIPGLGENMNILDFLGPEVSPEIAEAVAANLEKPHFPNQFHSTSNLGNFANQKNVSVDQLKGAIYKEALGPTMKWPLLEKGIISKYNFMPESLPFSELQEITNNSLVDLSSWYNLRGYEDGLFKRELPSLGFENLGNTYKDYNEMMGLTGATYEEGYGPENLKQTVFTGLGLGSKQHRNPEETLFHTRSYVDPDTPDTTNLMEWQADPFQGQYHIWNNSKKYLKGATKQLEALRNLTAEEWQNDFKLHSTTDRDYLKHHDLYSVSKEGEVNPKTKSWQDWKELKIKESEWDVQRLEGDILNATGRNKEQKQILEKNWQSMALQKSFELAANNGHTKVRLPTAETTIKIQGYEKVQQASGDNTIDWSNQNWGENLTNNTEGNTGLGIDEAMDYKKSHKTIIKKYSEKAISKLLLKSFNITKDQIKLKTDRNGNTWYEVEIPKTFLEGKAQIIHQDGGIVMDLNESQISNYAENGWIIEDV
jgi:hypothetical protein